ncbi:hypothetical protein Pla110_33040 [Polystyrenella longa]|uniref:Uncharacterized protein n=1 Tax=Polystyrenella longa TaxID=2528007 RepID=A0A518CQQ3_9PLAN|nr:hypothetical protein [Polystyrenella longa]QDU81562.1 hypothetical protein Pla110_33040 [Polystyrenella longa]
MTTKLSGHGGDITIGGIALEVEEWSGNYEAVAIETTNHGSGGFYEEILGPKKFSGSFTGKYNAELNSDAPLTLCKPTQGVAIVLKLGAAAVGGQFSFTGNLNNVGFTSAAQGEIGLTGDFVSVGTVTETNP